MGNEEKIEKERILDKFRKSLRQGIYTDDERNLIANTFADNEELIMAIRKFLLQGELLASEKVVLDKFVQSSESVALLRKAMLPHVNLDSPLGQIADMWASIDTKIKGAGEIQNDLLSRLVVVRYLEQQFDRMEGREKDYPYVVKDSVNQWENGDIQFKDLTFRENKGFENSFIDTQARHEIISQVDGILLTLRSLAIQIKCQLTPEELGDLMKRDSNK